MSKPQPLRLVESVAPNTRVDRDAGVIRGVKILGFESQNNREYSRAAVAKARGLYEGIRVNIDHPMKAGEQRRVADRFGRLVNVTEQKDGLYGDMEYLKSHPLAEMTVEVVERMPNQLGLSHNAEGRLATKHGKTIVEEITRVRSVDLVSDPATVRGLFESEGYMDGMDMGTPAATVEEPAADPKEAVKSGFRQAILAILDGEGDASAMVSQIKDLLKAQEQAMAKLDGTNKSGSGSGEGDGGAGAGASDGGDPATTAESSQNKPDPTTTELQEQVKRLKAESAARDLLESSGVKCDPVKLKAITALTEEADRKALIESWKPTAAIGKPRSSVLRESTEERNDAPAWPKTTEEFAALMR